MLPNPSDKRNARDSTPFRCVYVYIVPSNRRQLNDRGGVWKRIFLNTADVSLIIPHRLINRYNSLLLLLYRYIITLRFRVVIPTAQSKYGGARKTQETPRSPVHYRKR